LTGRQEDYLDCKVLEQFPKVHFSGDPASPEVIGRLTGSESMVVFMSDVFVSFAVGNLSAAVQSGCQRKLLHSGGEQKPNESV